MGDYIPTHIRAVANEVASIRKEICRLNQCIKSLRQLKSGRESILYDYMESKNIKNIQGITISSVKPRTKRKTVRDKKRDAYELFEEEGIEDPESFWKKFQRTQKYIARESEKDSDQEDFLGF